MSKVEDKHPAELLKLIKKRDQVKKSMHSIKMFIDKYDPTSRSINQLQTRLDSLRQYMAKYEVFQDEIEGFDSVTVEMLDDRVSTDDFCCSLKAEVLDLVERNNKATSDVSTAHSQSVIRDSMKLPSIPAPVFNGELQNWVSFLDSFNAMFHQNTGLSDVQRLHYLKSCLVGPAADVVRTIPTTDVNYHTAYNALVERYENKSLIIQSHIRSLFQTPQVHKPTASELRQLHHHIVSQVNALQALGQNVQEWDAWLVTLLCCRLDPTTVGEWQLLQTSKELPKFRDLEKFLANRVSAYEVGEVSNQSTQLKPMQKKVLFAHQNDNSPSKERKCIACPEHHRLTLCEIFNNMSINERQDIVFKNKLCYNCLYPGHQVRQCRGGNCNKCGKRHNTKLHHDKPYNQPPSANEQPSSPQDQSVVTYVEQANNNPTAPRQIMLATAVINLTNSTGQQIACRAILDSGSQVCLITRECASRLHISEIQGSVSLAGIGSVAAKTGTMISTTMCSRLSDYEASINFHVINSITNKLPSHSVNIHQLNIPDTILNCLADPGFHEPGNIDVLIGAEIFYELLIGESKKTPEGTVLHNTCLGWVLTGSMPIANYHRCMSSLLIQCQSRSSLALTDRPTCNLKENQSIAEAHFTSTVTQDHSGRFVVRLPFLRDPEVLGDSRFMAQQRFLNLERRMNRDSMLAQEYKKFMSEYIKMGHMEEAKDTDLPTYYLPHHTVTKGDSLTTKTRVVFDGSAVTRSGLSLNDILVCGPPVQPELLSIVLRFRLYRYALVADIEKMYRQVRVAPSDCDLQRIVFRSNADEELKDYRLLTVTYGTRAASFLATRCLLEASYTVQDATAQRAIQQDFYVDDLLTGCQTEEECYNLYQVMSTGLNKVGFPLRKWCSNSEFILSKMSNSESQSNYMLSISDEETISTLGLVWQPRSDCFKFIFKPWSQPLQLTKRSLLSDINRVFDPVGFVSPVLIRGKVFLQQLWALKLSWDTPLPPELQQKWIQFYASLKSLEQLLIPRHIPFSNSDSVQLHGFCDASQNAYGACIYILSTITGQGQLYCSKSRVAPLKASTIPRLELCGALLLAELVSMVSRELDRISISCSPSNVKLWSDSSIVLAWIYTDKPLKAYVSNRVAQILDLTSATQWRHVPTTSNPADIITRGCQAETLSDNNLWWHGPEWLSQAECDWPSSNVVVPLEMPELRIIHSILVVNEQTEFFLNDRYSSWTKLSRITAYLLRFGSNARNSKPSTRHVGPLSILEINKAITLLLKNLQTRAFEQEVADLRADKMVGRRSPLRTLNPFMDTDGLIRVGGRLSNADIGFNSKCPIVLPSKSNMTQLIFKHEHIRLLHIGPQGLLANIHLRYWPLCGRLIAKKTVRSCITCFRSSPKFIAPLMAPLPRERVNIERPFARTGVDFCGPILIRSGIRRVVSVKCYIAVFVCFVTRAVHLELVNGLTSDAFLAALTRFMARRGHCSHIYSDNGTNFVGANKVLYSYFKKTKGQRTVEEELSHHHVQWHFIPPSAPHFGGLWEAAVKSTKKHLLKVNTMGLLTFEEMSTMLCRIEAVLNSRPISPMSDDPSDFTALTPGHFLVGGVLTLPAEPDSTGIPLNRIKRLELVRVQAQTFWKRWSSEYLPQLHKRGCWLSKKDNIEVGSLAILKEDNLPPMKWIMVRVIQVHPGSDGVVRVVTVRNSAGREFQRPSTKLAVLPHVKDEEELV